MVDVDEYKNFWYHVGSFSFVDEITLQNIHDTLTQVMVPPKVDLSVIVKVIDK